jgi:hypothetical protein
LITDLLKPAVISFILAHEKDDVDKILFKHKHIHGVAAALVAQQIKGRKKAKSKLPSWYNTPNVFYPPSLNVEQSSSERTAGFKLDFLTDVFRSQNPSLGLDLTGGMGVDTFYLSRLFQQFHYVEPDEELIAVAEHNLRQLGTKNVVFENSTAESFLSRTLDSFDLIFIDPSRRSAGDRKVFTFGECEPDVARLQDKLFERSQKLLVKASPLLDIQQGLRELKHVKQVVVVAVENECKELLFYCEASFSAEARITAVDLGDREVSSVDFTLGDERTIKTQSARPDLFLYEPNVAILKAGAFKTVTKLFPVKKLHDNTHLYTSPSKVDNFPGRVFRIISAIKPVSADIEKYFPEKKANITLRNYPLTVNELKKRTGLKDGGDRYLIGFTAENGKSLVAAERLK